MIGSTIGTYRVTGLLGQGGMGTVYVAEHVLLGRRVALKVLLPAYSLDQEIVRRFFNEARAVTSISDPGIVQIFDFGIHTDGSAYIVMELLEGEPLDARLRRHGRLPPLDAVRLVRQCAGSLAAAHARGIIHRDLKPENLYAVGDPAVTGGERLKILDFGIAKLVGDEVATSRTRTGVLMGTPIYMSPEQCRGLGELDFRSDVYSLGCVLFALIAGRPPFVHDSTGELIVAHLREPPPSLTELVAGVPRELDDVVRIALAKSPAERHASMQAFAHALDVVVATVLVRATGGPYPTPVPVAPTSPHAVTTLGTGSGETTAPRARIGRRGAVIAATAVVLVGLGIAGVALRGRGGPEGPTSSAPANAAAPVAAAAPEDAAAPADVAIDTAIDAGAGAAIDAGVDASPTPSAASSGRAAPPGPAASPAPKVPIASPASPAPEISKPPASPASPAPETGKPSRSHRPRPRTNQEEPHVPPPSNGSAIDRGD